MRSGALLLLLALGLALDLALALPAQTAALAEQSALARSYLASNRFAEAAAIYASLVKALPGNPGLLLNQGMALHMAGEDAKAIPPLEAALKLNPRLPPALLFLGASYMHLGQHARALPPLESFAALDPNHVEARKMLVDAATQAGQPLRALPHWEKLAQLEPQRPGLWYELGRQYEQLAAATFGAMEKSFPESGPWFALLGDSRSKVTQRKAAFFFYRKAVAKSPALRGVHAAIADIYTQDGHPEWAAVEKAAEAKLGAPNCAVRSAECEFRAGRFGAVISLARPTAEGQYWKVRAYDALARAAFARLAALPASVESLRWQAETKRDQGRHTEAVAAWREALRLEPGHPDLQRELAAALLATKEYAEAQQLTGALLANEPTAADLQHLQGDLFLAQQQAEAAVPFLEKAVAQDPRLLPARASLARALLLAGRPADALPHVQAALPLDTDGSLHFQLARAYQAAGQAEAAQAAMAQYQKIQARGREQDQVLEDEVKITPP